MPKVKISEYSSTANSNTDVASINIDEGCAPSGINNAIRAVMGHLKDFQAGLSGDTLPVASGGTGVTTSTGTGNVVLSTSPTLVTPALGTPSSGTVTNLTGTASININGTVGATTASTGNFTTLTTSSTVTHNGGTANGVAFLNGSKVLTTGSALVFDGTNLGIGTSSPGNIFSVSGGMPFRAQESSGTLFYDFGRDTNTGAFIINGNQAGVPLFVWQQQGAERMRIDSSGNLLVGMTAAFGKISIGQNSQLSYGQGLSFYFSGSSYWNIVNGNSNRLYFGFNGSDRAYIDSATGAFVPVSDQRLKKNIADISYGVSSVLALRPVSYNMKDQEDTAEKTLGFIAQDALQVVPESVSEMMGGMLGMDKSALIPVLVKAIQEQQALITALTTRITALESN